MKTAEEKAELMRQQVFAKVRWGARDKAVLDWLQEQHRITGSEAEALITEARRAVRSKALLTLIFSLLGILLAGGFVEVQFRDGLVVIGRGSVLLVVFGCFSFGVFCRSLVRLLTGSHRRLSRLMQLSCFHRRRLRRAKTSNPVR
jgi:hypothetical protein